MTPSIDVEITSETTARAILASAEVDPVDLQATETETLEAVVHRFLHSVAKGQNVELEVVYRRGENSRHLTVLSNGKVEPRTPSTPIPTAAPTAPPPTRAEDSSAPPTGPVVVAAEPLTYETQSEVVPHPQTPAPSRPQAPSQTVDRRRWVVGEVDQARGGVRARRRDGRPPRLWQERPRRPGQRQLPQR